jgi:hypothetical protein
MFDLTKRRKRLPNMIRFNLLIIASIVLIYSINYGGMYLFIFAPLITVIV